jgi:hypothetical protein
MSSFGELRNDEVRHSPTPIGPGDAGEGMLISPGIMCWCARTQETTRRRPGEGLGHRGGAKRRAEALYRGAPTHDRSQCAAHG